MSDLSDQELKFGYWYVVHREQFKRALYILVGGIGIILVAYSGWQWIEIISSQQAEEESLRILVGSEVNFQDYHRRNQPLPLEVGLATATPGISQSTFDLIAQVKNPNPRWGARTVSFTFTVGQTSISGSSFLLPLEDKYVISLGIPLERQPEFVSLTINGVGWQRIRDVAQFPIPAFSVTEQETSQLSPAGGGVSGTQLDFQLTNESAYNFWEVGVTAVLARGSTIQAVGYQTLKNVISGGVYAVQFFWPRGLGATDRLIVKPEVNVLDPATLRPV